MTEKTLGRSAYENTQRGERMYSAEGIRLVNFPFPGPHVGVEAQTEARVGPAGKRISAHDQLAIAAYIAA
jgi:hypothetical protein